MPETEEQKSPEPDDQAGDDSPTPNDGLADEHEDNEHEDRPYLRRLSDDDPLMFTTDLD